MVGTTKREIVNLIGYLIVVFPLLVVGNVLGALFGSLDPVILLRICKQILEKRIITEDIIN